jgi:hypothetical protein
VSYHVDRSLDDATVVFVAQTGAGLQRIELPAAGESRTIAAAELPLRLLDPRRP